MSRQRPSVHTHRSNSPRYADRESSHSQDSYSSDELDDGTWAEDYEDIDPNDSASASGYENHHVPVRRAPRRHTRPQQRQTSGYRAPSVPHETMSTDPSDDYQYMASRQYNPPPGSGGYYGQAQAPSYAPSHLGNGYNPYGASRGQLVTGYHSHTQNPFTAVAPPANPSYYSDPRNSNYDMVPFHHQAAPYYGGGPAYGPPGALMPQMPQMPQYMFNAPPPPPPTETPAARATPAPVEEKKPDPEVEKIRQQLELLQAEKKAKEDHAKEQEIKDEMRKQAELEAQRRFEETLKAQAEAAKELEKAKIEAERAARERMEAERKAEEDRARQQAEILQRIELEARAKIEAERRAEEKRRKRDAEMAAAAEAALKAKIEAVEAEAKVKIAAEFKAQQEAKEAAERKAKEEAEFRKMLEAEAKIKIAAEIKAQQEAKEAAEKKAKEEAEFRKMLEDEAKLRAEAEARARLEEEKKKAEEARIAMEEAKKAEAAMKAKMMEEAKAKIEADAKKKEKAPIKFKDAVNRKFSFPFHLCQTWQGMEELIKQAFLHIEVVGPQVQEGYYDLIGPDGEIILPTVWEKVIQPDWSISMQMWPMDKMPPFRRQVPGMPQGGVPVGAGPRYQPMQGMAGRGMPMQMPGGMPMRGVPGGHAHAGPPPPRPWPMAAEQEMPLPVDPRRPVAVVVDGDQRRESKKKGTSGAKPTRSSGLFAFMGGPKPTKAKKRK